MTKKLEASTVKCKGCGSDLIFNPKTQSLLCRSCGKSQTFPKFKKIGKHLIDEDQNELESYKDWISQNKCIKCQTCGATIVLNTLEYSKQCPYCESTYVAEADQLPGFSPDSVIPFAFDEDEARLKFQANVKKKFLVPSSLKKQLPKSKLLGMYIPSFSFDAQSFSKYNGVLVRQTTNSKGETSTHIIPISGEKALKHSKITIETSSKLDQSQIDSLLPYDTREMYKFDERFIKGYVVEHYDQSLTESHKIARAKMRKAIKANILKNYSYTYIQSLNISTSFSNELFTYRLNPVYIFEYQYKGNPYRTFMNGQTGKIGKGLPISKVKIVCFIVLILALLVVIPLLIVLL